MDILKSVLAFLYQALTSNHKTLDRKNPKEDMENIQREYARYKQNPELMIESEKEILFSWIYNSQDITAQEGAFFDKHQVPNIIVSKYLNAKFFFEAFNGETFKLKSKIKPKKRRKYFLQICVALGLITALSIFWVWVYSLLHSQIHTQSIIDIGTIILFICFSPLSVLVLEYIERQAGKRNMADDFLEYIKNLN